MNKELVISFKITNWCNLHCDHCCERSNKHNKPNFMSLEKMERFLSESKTMDIRPNQLLTIGGGEALAPYMFGQPQYIPSALDLIYSYDYIPTLKTNGTWGNNNSLRPLILSDIARCAYKHMKLVTLDISVDEFHDNKSGVIKIMRDILCTPDLCYAIRICLVGFNTPESTATLLNVKQQLTENKFEIDELPNKDWAVYAPNQSYGAYVINNFGAPIYNLGRAKQTKTFTSIANPNGNDGSNCLQIDNNDYAILNYTYREPIKNRTLNEVVSSLMTKAR